MKLKKFQSSTFDTMARRKLFEDQNTILELSGRVQELQNEVNCMNDSKDFQDAESVRSGNPTLPVDQCRSHLVRYLKGCCDILSYRRAAEKGRQAFGTHMVYWETFLANPDASSSAPYPQELNHWNSSIEEPLHSSTMEKSERTRSRSEMPVWTVSQEFSHLQLRRLFKELWSRPTTTADFGSSFRQIPYTIHVRLLEDKIQDRGV